MTLSPIGDIATSALTENTGATITWSTSSDWDNNVSEDATSHPSDVVQLYNYEVLMDEEDGSTSEYGGQQSFFAAQSSPTPGSFSDYSVEHSTDSTEVEATNSIPDSKTTYWFWVRPGNQNDEFIFEQSDGTFIFGIYFRSDEGGIYWNDAPNDQRFNGVQLENVGSGTWRLLRVYNIDLSAQSADVELYDTSFTQTASSTGRNLNSGGSFAQVRHSANFGNSQSKAEVDSHPYGLEGKLTTGTKSFSTSSAPDLQNLTYNRNGETIVLDVIGSPGTASEEVVTQTLDGSSSYTLSWSNTHTDFRVRIEFTNTSDVTTTPTVSQIELTNI